MMRWQTTSGNPYLAHYNANHSHSYGITPLGQSSPMIQHFTHTYPYPPYPALNAENAGSSFVNPAFLNQKAAKTNSSGLFENPLQPKTHSIPAPVQMDYLHPYPKGGHVIKPASGGFHAIINSFKNQDGTLDMNKMIDTAGQMMSVMNQFSSVVKGLGSVFKQ